MRAAAWGPTAACLAVFLLAWGLSVTDAGQAMDRTLLEEMERLPGDSRTWAEASWPGSTVVAGVVLLAAAGTALALRQPRAGWAIAACAVVVPVVWVLKLVIARDRPETLLEDDLAMPSGHAAMSVVAYGSIALLLVPVLRARGAPAWVRPFARGTWLGLAFAVGVARVAAGVHWPLDVIAGWAVGGAILAAAMAVARGSPPTEPAPKATQPAL